jgi:hypothetical protein
MNKDKHVIRVFIGPDMVDIQAECHSSIDAECRVNIEEGIIASSICRYVQWWQESEVSLEEFYGSVHKKPLVDGAEIDIYWDGECWAWELKKND